MAAYATQITESIPRAAPVVGSGLTRDEVMTAREVAELLQDADVDGVRACASWRASCAEAWADLAVLAASARGDA